MRAHFGLPSVEAEDKEGKPPISVKFEIPYFTTSGIQVRPQGFQDPEQLWTGPTGPCRTQSQSRPQGLQVTHSNATSLEKHSCQLVLGAMVLPQLCLPHGQPGPQQKEAHTYLLRPAPRFSSKPNDAFGPRNWSLSL